MNRLKAHQIDQSGAVDGDALLWDAAEGKWVPASASGSGVPATLLDAKGDLIAASAADTAARLPIGSPGQVLTVDPAEALGMKWADSAGGGGTSRDFDPGWALPLIAGRWYDSQVGTIFTGSQSQVSGEVVLVPFFVPAQADIDAGSIQVTTATPATIHVGMYDSTAAAIPNSKIIDFGSVSAGVIGVKTLTLGSPVTIDAGLYWLAMVPVGASGAMRSVTGEVGGAMFGWTAAGSFSGQPRGYRITGQTSLPASAAGATADATNNLPRIQVRAA